MISDIIKYLYPGSMPRRDFELQDDGKGPYIAKWNRPEVKPEIDYILSKKQEYEADLGSKGA